MKKLWEVRPAFPLNCMQLRRPFAPPPPLPDTHTSLFLLSHPPVTAQTLGTKNFLLSRLLHREFSIRTKTWEQPTPPLPPPLSFPGHPTKVQTGEREKRKKGNANLAPQSEVGTTSLPPASAGGRRWYGGLDPPGPALPPPSSVRASPTTSGRTISPAAWSLQQRTRNYNATRSERGRGPPPPPP